MRRVFIDWGEPLLPAVVRLLIEASAPKHDLSGVIVVVPGRRAGRRFRELLTDSTAGRHDPPRIVTVSELPELLYEPQKPFASELTQRLAWIAAIQALPPERLDNAIRRLPDSGDIDGWYALAEILWRQHRELAADGLNFSDVLGRGCEIDAFSEHDRWETLAEIQQAYLRELDALGLWDRQTARLVALQQREFVSTSDVILVGMSDLTLIQRQMLDQLPGQVTAYVHAPESLSNAFDAHGCVVPDVWETVNIPVADEQVVVADGPAEAGGCVAAALSRFAQRFQADEISIGLADDSSARLMVRRLSDCGVAARWAVGMPVSRTTPVRLLSAVADCLESDRTAEFAALVRHCDVGDWLTTRQAPAGWLPGLDRFIQDHAPQRLCDWTSHADAADWRPVFEAVEELLEPLRGGPRPLSEWPQSVTQILTSVYEQTLFDPEAESTQQTLAGFDALQKALEEQARSPAELSPRVSAASAIRLTLRALTEQTVPPPPNSAAVEMMGWLDIAHDDAPATIVVGLNEGLIPQSTTADPFLPDPLRSALGVTDNQRRYARDAHALMTLLHSCRDTVLIACRRDVRGDPLAPSRLLLTGEGDERAQRVREFYRPQQPAPKAEPPAAPLRDHSGFTVPRPPATIPPPETLSVTAFRDYLASPYRFYLRHVLKLAEMDDAVDELSAASFGNLAHTVLARFGESGLKDSHSPVEIAGFLSSELDAVARETYGESPMMAVEIQLEQARTRLRAFADWQAKWARQGWRIERTEAQQGKIIVPLDLGDGRTVMINGRIDRIDRHTDGRWVIFDYKTGESTSAPEKSHRKDGEWIDLQLPLYRHLARKLGVEGDVQVGYIRLPRSASDVGEEIAAWSADDLATADEAAREVARKVLEGQYWVELTDEPKTLSEYGPICQDGVFDREIVV